MMASNKKVSLSLKTFKTEVKECLELKLDLIAFEAEPTLEGRVMSFCTIVLQTSIA